MRRTNEEFRTEVFRRKDAYLKARNKRIARGVLSALVCMPFCCVAIMLAIAMQPAGNAAPGDGNNMYSSVPSPGDPASGQKYYIPESDERFEYISAFLAEVTAREPEKGEFGWVPRADFNCEFFVGAERRVYYVNENYLFDGENTFYITVAEYEKLRDIMRYKYN